MLCPAGDRSGTQAASPGLQKRRQRPLPDFAGSPADLCCALRARGLEPKRLRLVCRRAGDAPSLLLLEARRGGRPGLDIAAPLCLEDGTGRPTAELDNAYFRTKETNA